MTQPKSEKRVWNIHYGDKQQIKMKVQRGLSPFEIMENIRNLVGYTDIICLDEDQDVIALASSLPSGSNIFVIPKQQLKYKASKTDMKENDMDSKESVSITHVSRPLIYGYADRAGGGAQKYSFDNGGCGEPIIFTNVTNNGCCNVGNMLNSQNGRFTAPIHGIYTFTVSAWLKGGDANNAQLWFNYNGNRQQTFSAPIHNHASIFTGSLTLEIKKDHYIDFRMYQASFKGSVKEIPENFHHTYVRWALIEAVP
eukprot:542218_1